MRRVLLCVVVGALPGMLIGFEVLVSASLDVITSDQSQIGFIGVPPILFGMIAGTLDGGSGTPYLGRLTIGMGIGFVLGIGGGIAVDSALQAIGSTVGGTLLFVTPAAIIAGGVLGAWHGEHTNPPQLPISQA
jgi:hypothetical protein